MTRIRQVAFLITLLPLAGFAQTSEGVLVNSTCYYNVDNNVNPAGRNVDAARDRDFELRFCHADARTKAFAVVQSDGQSFKLDNAGNAKAAEIVRKGNPKNMFVVQVTGKIHNESIAVDSITLLRNPKP